MSNVAEINPMLKRVNDQFDDVFGESVSPQMKTVVAVSDALFGGAAGSRLPNAIDKLDIVKAFIRTASMEDCQTIISELIERVSDEVGSAYYLEEAFAELGKEL